MAPTANLGEYVCRPLRGLASRVLPLTRLKPGATFFPPLRGRAAARVTAPLRYDHSRLSDYFSDRRLLIETHLAALAQKANTPAVLAKPIARALTSPGKRVRGILLIAAG